MPSFDAVFDYFAVLFCVYKGYNSDVRRLFLSYFSRQSILTILFAARVCSPFRRAKFAPATERVAFVLFSMFACCSQAGVAPGDDVLVPNRVQFPTGTPKIIDVRHRWRRRALIDFCL